MLETAAAEFQGSFRALADPNRRLMLKHLSERDMTIGEVAAHFDMTRAAVKKHLTVLEDGKLISVHARGRERINRLEPMALKSVSGWLDHFNAYWDDKLNTLKTAVETAERNKTMASSTIVKTVMFSAPREAVWAFLTEKDKLALWFHPAEADLSEGADFALLSAGDEGPAEKICWGSVLEMERPSRLKYSFTIKPLGGVMTTVTWLLDEVHGGTKLTLEHEGFDAAGDSALGLLSAIDAGWDKHFAKLREAVAG